MLQGSMEMYKVKRKNREEFKMERIKAILIIIVAAIYIIMPDPLPIAIDDIAALIVAICQVKRCRSLADDR